MSAHEIYQKKLVVMVMPKRRYRGCKVDERPAGFGYFNIRELQYILNDIQRYPFREIHYFTFRGRRFRIKVVEEDPEDRDSDDTKGAYTGPTGTNR